jgi:hypothetical protein
VTLFLQIYVMLNSGIEESNLDMVRYEGLLKLVLNLLARGIFMTDATKPTLSEATIQELEDQIPGQAALATRLAYETAKRSGQTVVVSKGGFIVAEYTDGSEQRLASAKPRRKVRAGVSIDLRCGPFLDVN